MSQSGARRDEQPEELHLQIGEETVSIDVEPAIAQMFQHIQQATGGNRSVEEALAEFIRQYKPKLEEQFQTVIFNEYQQVRLQQKVGQNGQVELEGTDATVEPPVDDDDVSPEDTTSPNRL